MYTGENLPGDFHISPVLDVIAIVLFGITGALSGAKRGYDIIGTLAIALVTGCGGGLLRDQLLNVRPALLEDERYLWAVLISVFLSVYFCGYISRIKGIFLVADALGLAIYAVIGTQKALYSGLGVTAAVLIGTLNGIGGGMIRDILTREELSVLKPGQWYASIALGASALFGILSKFTDLPKAAIGTGVVVAAFVARLIVRRYDFQTRPIKPIGFESNHW